MSTRLKQEFRKIYYAKRREISATIRHQAALTAAEHFLQYDLFKQSQAIACYMPFRDEFDVTPLISKIWREKKQCYLPVLTKEKVLSFVCYDEGDKLIANRYSILEPQNTFKRIQASNLDMVIMPLVVFDTYGHRLGMGGGYYDRTFAFLRYQINKKPLLVGVAYALQQAELVPTDPWDVNLQVVMTENGLFHCET